jgi:hypothetical protein
MSGNAKALATLQGLAQLDVDASFAYRRAIAAIEIPDIRRELVWAWRDHERHVEALGTEIRRLGGETPSHGRDMKGFAIEGVTALRSALGAISALRAMRMNERLTNAQYEAALKAELPESAWAVVSRNRGDERRHLDFIEFTLATRADEIAEHEARLLGLPASKLILGASVLLAGLGIAWGIRAWTRGEPAPRRRRIEGPRLVEARAHHWTRRHEVGAHRARDIARELASPSLE